MEGYSSSGGGGVGVGMNREQSSFWQFSDQLRLETTSLSNLSIGDSIWSDSFVRKPEDRRNYEAPISPAVAAAAAPDVAGWKTGFGMQQKLAFGSTNTSLLDRYNNSSSNNSGASSKSSYRNGPGGGGAMNDGNYYSGYGRGVNTNTNYNSSGEIKNYFSKAIDKPANSGGHGKKNSNSNNDGSGGKKKNNGNRNSNNGSGGSNGGNNAATDKWFKTLPPAEALPRNEAVGGYIFVCNNETMEENLKRQLFGLPSRYRDSVRAITPGLPLFLYNYSTHQLHGIYEAASFGGTNIDPMAWEDKKCPGESRFPAQVKVMTRKICGPLEEDAFRPILHHYDGPKFRLELSVPEALELLDVFVEKNA